MDKDLVHYFIEETNKKFDEVKEEIREINTKVDTILQFKWQIIGGAIGVSSFIGLVVNLFFRFKGG